MMVDILFIYAKLKPETSYRQVFYPINRAQSLLCDVTQSLLSCLTFVLLLQCFVYLCAFSVFVPPPPLGVVGGVLLSILFAHLCIVISVHIDIDFSIFLWVQTSASMLGLFRFSSPLLWPFSYTSILHSLFHN